MVKPKPGRSSPNGYLPGQMPKYGFDTKRAAVQLLCLALLFALGIGTAILLFSGQ